MSFTKIVGRLLIATILISSAYHHLTKPQAHTQLFIKNYGHLVDATKSFTQGVLPASQTLNWLLFVKVFGLFQGLIALFILFNDSFGGILWTLSLIIQGVFLYSCSLCSGKFLQWTVAQQVGFAKHVLLLGIALILICPGKCNKTKCQKQSQCSK